nr:hypothetical protein [Tanacetum cinerariifolium]
DESSESSVLRETSLRDDVDVGGSDEPHSKHDIDPKRGKVKDKVDRVTHPAVSDDIPEPAQEEGAIEGTYEMLGDLGHMIIATGHQSAFLSKRISELEWDNMRLRGTTIPNTRSRATMTRKAVNELIDRRVAEALETHNPARNLKSLVKGKGEQEDVNRGGNGNGGVNGNGNDNGNRGGNGNGNVEGNGYGNHNMNPEGFMSVARECTYQDFLKFQPLNFNRRKESLG